MHHKIMGGLAVLLLALPLTTLAQENPHQEAPTPLAFYLDLLGLGGNPMEERGADGETAIFPDGEGSAGEESADKGISIDPNG